MADIAAAFEPAPHGLTSDEIVKRALEHSPELRKAQLAEDTAAANKARSKLAFAPRFDFTGKYTHLSRVEQPNFFGGIIRSIGNAFALGDPVNPPPDGGFPQILDQWYSQASASLPVTDIFLTVIPTYKGASRLASVADQRRQASELQVSHDARVAFYGYAHVIGAVIVAQTAVGLLQSNVRDLEALVQAGTATETDLIRARAELGKLQATTIELTGERDIALARLASITGTDVDGTRGIGERFVGMEVEATPEVSKIRDEARRSRPELIALRKLEEARNYLAQARRGAQYPKLNGFSNFYYANPHPRVIPQEKDWQKSWDVGVALSWSPNDSVFAHTQYKDGLTELASVREDLRLIEDGIGIEAAHAVSAHRTAVARIDATAQSLEAARRYQADQRELLLAGAATPNDALEAQVQLTRAALEWVDSFINVRLAQAALLKARGKTGLGDKSSTAAGSSTP
jgi:outer membrane protein TolC